MKYPNSVRKIRHFRKMTVAEIAKKCDVEKSYIYAIERGDRRLNADTIKSLADHLNIDADFIICSPDELVLEPEGENGDDYIEILSAFKRLTPRLRRATITFINSITEART